MRLSLPRKRVSGPRGALALVAAVLSCTTALVLTEVSTSHVADAASTADPGPNDAPNTSTLSDGFVDTANDPPSRTPTIRLTAPQQATVGTATTISVKVSGVNTAGEIANLEQRDGETWDAAASSTVGSDNTVSIDVTPADAGTYSYRVHLAATTQHDEAFSDPIVVTIASAASATPTPTAQPTAEPTGPECGGDAPVKADGTPWVCTYDDEFDGSTLNHKFWLPQVSAKSGMYSGTATAPACYVDDPRVINVSNGDLVLGAKVVDTPVTCGTKKTNEISGMVSHNGTFSQTYGKYEVRAKVPSFAGKGLQETLWLWPNDALKYGYTHPASGEIDFAEFYSTYPTLTVPVAHYLFDPSTLDFTTNTNIYTSWNCTIQVGEYNTYGVEWSPGLIKIFVNGSVCMTDNYKAYNATADHPYAPFDQPFFLALTQAFGTTGNEFDPATGPKDSETLVDYVRVWK